MTRLAEEKSKFGQVVRGAAGVISGIEKASFGSRQENQEPDLVQTARILEHRAVSPEYEANGAPQPA